MNSEQRQRIIELLQTEKDLDFEWKRVLFPPGKRESELAYDAKERAEEVLSGTMGVPFQPVRTLGGRERKWSNMLIFGDNLQAMKTLQGMKRKGELLSIDGTPGVRLVYIDPPFATKREFKGVQNQKAYQDKIAGVEFIEFLRKRFIFLRELLSQDGSLFVHCDHRKGHYLKVVLDEIFGEHNFRNEIVLPGRAAKNLQKQFSQISRLNVRHDVLLWYTVNSSTRFKPRWIFKHKAGNPEGHWHHFWSTADRATMRYPLLGHTPKTGQWTWRETRAKRAIDSFRRYLNEGGGRTLAEYWRDTGCALDFIRKSPDDGKPQYWRAPAENRLADTCWAGVPIYNNSTGFPTEKNEALLGEIVELASSEGDLVLDAFAGSGTTLAVAEKLRRRWIGIDCSKLSIYTIQKRMLNLRGNIGNKGKSLKPKPFKLFNAGLYDFSRLRELPWKDWRFFALKLFQCKDEPHRIGGLALDGYLKGCDVLIYNHFQTAEARVTYETIDDIHEAVGKKVGRRFFIVAPAICFDFQEDYVDRGATRYYALRIPYSIINELHQRDFTAIRQPANETEVNDTVESVGFDFIRTPEAKVNYRIRKSKGALFEALTIRVTTFRSEVVSPGVDQPENLESLSMLFLDLNYDGEVFDLDHFVFREVLKESRYTVHIPCEDVGDRIMLVLLDIYGNEFREVKTFEESGKISIARPGRSKKTKIRASKHAATT